MQSREFYEFPFDPNYNYCTDNLICITSHYGTSGPPPEPGDFELLDNTGFLLLAGINFLLL